MMTEKRRVYTAECKRAAVRLVTDHGDGVTEAARHVGSNGKMLGRWQRQAAQQTNGRCGSNRPMSAENAALLRWRQAVTRRRMAREMVKKATAFFATESRGETPASPTTSRPGRSW
jgi:transposase